MSLDEFILGFADQFDDTEVSEINEGCYFQELDEWSSVTVMSVIAFIKTKYKKTVLGPEIRKCETVKDLYDLVVSK